MRPKLDSASPSPAQDAYPPAHTQGKQATSGNAGRNPVDPAGTPAAPITLRELVPTASLMPLPHAPVADQDGQALEQPMPDKAPAPPLPSSFTPPVLTTSADMPAASGSKLESRWQARIRNGAISYCMPEGDMQEQAQLRRFLRWLAKSPQVTSLSIKVESGPALDVDAIMAIAEALHDNPRVTTRDVSGNGIDDAGAQAFAAMLRDNSPLKALNLSYNHISEAGVRELAAALRINTTLATLDLYANLIGDVGALELSAALHDNSTLAALDLGHNGIGVAGAQALAAALRVNTALATLKLKQNEIGDAGVLELATTLRDNSTLTTLDLGDNRIGDDGARGLAAMLCNNSSLTALDVGYNTIDNGGARKLAAALRVNTTLRMLNIEHNNIGYTSTKALASALRFNRTLTTLDLSGNAFDREELDGVKQYVDLNRDIAAGLKTLEENPYTAEQTLPAYPADTVQIWSRMMIIHAIENRVSPEEAERRLVEVAASIHPWPDPV